MGLNERFSDGYQDARNKIQAMIGKEVGQGWEYQNLIVLPAYTEGKHIFLPEFVWFFLSGTKKNVIYNGTVTV